MQTIVDIGKRGAENIGEFTRASAEALPGAFPEWELVRKFPLQDFYADSSDGVKKKLQVRTLALHNPQVFSLMHKLAASEPQVYARQGERTVMGMLSANYDQHGVHRQPSIKVIPLLQPYPLIARGDSLVPDARNATMLAGAVGLERQGVGSDSDVVVKDPEHRLTIMGSIAANNAGIALRHENHEVRHGSSVASGLTNGRLGSLFVPRHELDYFAGFAEPMVFRFGATSPDDALFIPDSFMGSEEAYGGFYADSDRIFQGASLEALYANSPGGQQEVTRVLGELAAQLQQEPIL